MQEMTNIEKLQARAEKLLAAGAALSTRDLALKGNDLMRELGLTPGPIVGKLLERLLEVVTDDPSKNNREALLEEARRFLASDRS